MRLFCRKRSPFTAKFVGTEETLSRRRVRIFVKLGK